MGSALYLIGTPIGNLDDISLRALRIMKEVSWIACEDKRVSHVLMQAYGIKTPLLSYHEHNATQQRPKILEALGRGESGALISDAGMPLISDPGYKLVEACLEKKFSVSVIPGPSAPFVALCLSGLPSDRFFFQGFLPLKTKLRCQILEKMRYVSATLIFFEAPHRIEETLADLLKGLGNRQAALCRELTKKFEETRRGTLEVLLESCREIPPRGEITLVVEGAAEVELPDQASLEKLIEGTLRHLSFKETVGFVAQETGFSRGVVYEKTLKILDRKGSNTP